MTRPRDTLPVELRAADAERLANWLAGYCPPEPTLLSNPAYRERTTAALETLRLSLPPQASRRVRYDLFAYEFPEDGAAALTAMLPAPPGSVPPTVWRVVREVAAASRKRGQEVES